MESETVNNNIEDESWNGWVIKQSISNRRYYYYNLNTKQSSWDVPACMDTLSFTDTAPTQWKLKKFILSHLSQKKHSLKTLLYYKNNPEMVFDFSILPAPAVQLPTPVPEENSKDNMSNKRSYKGHVDESNRPEKESVPHRRRNKRARRQTASFSSSSDTQEKESDIECLRVGEKESKKSIGVSGKTTPREIKTSKNEIIPNVTSERDVNETNKPRSPGYHQYNKSTRSTEKQKSIERKADKSWQIHQSDCASTLSPVSSYERSLSKTSLNPSESSNFTSPKTWSTKVKVNSAEQRLALFQQNLRINQESATSSTSGSLKDQLVHGPVKGYLTNLESSSNLLKVAESSFGVAGNSLRPKKSAKKRVCDRLLEKLSEKHLEKKLQVPYQPKVKPASEKESPVKLAPCSSALSSSTKKNFAEKRLERIQQQLLVQSASTPVAQCSTSSKSLTVPAQTNISGQTEFSESSNLVLQECSQKLSHFDRAATSSGVYDKTSDDNFEEQMDWEPNDQQLNSMILDIHKLRTQFQGRDFLPEQSASNYAICTSNEKSNYFIVLDSNFLMGHLKLVESLRDRQFPVLEPLVLILPWVVIQELDKLKDWRSNKKNYGHSAMAATLARAAVKWINLQLQEKHPRVKGQTCFNRTVSTIACSVADDSILACCKEMEPFATNVVLLTEDVNLQNKALMLDIQVLSQSQLKARLNKLATQSPSCCSTRQSTTALSCMDREPGLQPLNELAEIGISADEAKKSDEILCDVKIHVRNYLEEVAKVKMEDAFGKTWIVDLNISLPWYGLSDVIQFIIKRWRSIFGFVCQDREILTKFEELLAFLQDRKTYNHSLKEVDNFIGTCIDVITGMPIKSNCPIQDGCLKSLKQLQDKCKNLPAKPFSTSADFEAVRTCIEKPLAKIWTNLKTFCFYSCEFLQIEHDIELEFRAETQPPKINLEMIRIDLKDFNTQFYFLIVCLNRLLEIPADLLVTDNTFIQYLHRELTQLSLEHFSNDQYPSIDSFVEYCTNESCRDTIRASIKMFQYYNSYLERIGTY